MAELLAMRLGEDPGFLLRNPNLSQTAAIGAGMLGSHVLGAEGAKAAILPALSLLAVQALRHKRIEDLQEEYVSKHRHKRLRDIAGLQDALDFSWLDNPHARLGRVMTYQTMKDRKYEPMGPLAESGDAIFLAGHATGIGAPASLLSGYFDKREADKRMEKLSSDRPRGKHDQRRNTTLPLFLLSMLGGGAGTVAASGALHSFLKGQHKIEDKQVMQRLVDEVAGRHVPVETSDGMNNAAFIPSYPERIAVGQGFASPAVLAHEAGHARAEKLDDLTGFLQRNLYPISRMAGPLAGAGSLAAGLASGGPVRGALLGTLIGGLGGAGVLLPEYRASTTGLEGLSKFDGGSLSQPDDKKLLASALGTYLAASVLPSTLAGAAGGYISSRRKKDEEQQV